jgi:bacteriocin-like protein
MRELNTNELDAVNGGTVLSYPGVYIQELPGTVHSIPGVSTSTGRYLHVNRNEKMIRRF